MPDSGETAVERANRRQADDAAKRRQIEDMAAIKHREQNVRDAIRRGEPMVDTQGFCAEQLGLRGVVADEWGRLWRGGDGTRLVLVFSPAWFNLKDREGSDE